MTPRTKACTRRRGRCWSPETQVWLIRSLAHSKPSIETVCVYFQVLLSERASISPWIRTALGDHVDAVRESLNDIYVVVSDLESLQKRSPPAPTDSGTQCPAQTSSRSPQHGRSISAASGQPAGPRPAALEGPSRPIRPSWPRYYTQRPQGRCVNMPRGRKQCSITDRKSPAGWQAVDRHESSTLPQRLYGGLGYHPAHLLARRWSLSVPAPSPDKISRSPCGTGARRRLWMGRSLVPTRRLRGRIAKRRPIEARALVSIKKHVQEAIELLKESRDLQSNQPHRGASQQEDGTQLRRTLVGALSSATSDLQGVQREKHGLGLRSCGHDHGISDAS